MTKIIHCADLHLDSPMETHMTEEQASTRNTEIIHSLECCNREDNSATASASKEYVKQNIEKYKAYFSGKLPHEKLSPADELQANLIADTEWFMRNQILMEYITELFQKNYKR